MKGVLVIGLILSVVGVILALISRLCFSGLRAIMYEYLVNRMFLLGLLFIGLGLFLVIGAIRSRQTV